MHPGKWLAVATLAVAITQGSAAAARADSTARFSRTQFAGHFARLIDAGRGCR